MLLAPTVLPNRRIQRLFEPSETEERDQELRALGFQNLGGVREVITYWRKRLESSQAYPKEREILIKLVPALISGVLQTPHPDQSLFYLDRYLRSVGRRLGILAMLRERTALVREILALFARSALLARLFIQTPEMIDRLALRRESDFSFFSDWPTPLPRKKGPAGDPEEALARLRQWKNEHYLEIALEEMAGRLKPNEASYWLSRLADQVIAETARLAEETLSREIRPPVAWTSSSQRPAAPCCILGLGKLGGRGLGYASDLDLMFIYSLKTPFQEEEPARTRSSAKDRRPLVTWHEYLVRLAQRLISYLSLPLREGPGYAVDARLRPSGTFGPLVVSLDSFREDLPGSGSKLGTPDAAEGPSDHRAGNADPSGGGRNPAPAL